MSYLDTIREQLDSKIADAEEFLSRDGFDPADPAYEALTGEIDTLKRSWERAVEIHNTRQSAIKVGDSIARAETRQRAAAKTDEGSESLGSMFVRSSAFTEYRGRGHGDRFESEMVARALPMGTATFPVHMDPLSRPAREPAFSTPLLDLVPTMQTGVSSFPIVGLEVVAGGPAEVAENAIKPSVEFGETSIQVTVSTKAVYTKFVRQLVEDAPFIRSAIDTKIRRLLLQKMDGDILAAIGAATLPTATGADLLKAIRKGIGAVQSAGYTPNAVLLNPADYADLDINVFGATLLGPSVSGQFWGLRPVPAPGQAAGTAVVGDFSTAVTRYERAGIALYLSDSNENDFIHNRFTLLAEYRDDVVVPNPDALVEVSATP